ncbi:MAG: lysylphosphatidylglycerol synthase transmembrane domain-containing protein, partial [Polyangiales bacterium]
AYGASQVPSWARLGHLYLVGHFYNTYAPGGVGGDVVRGVASRRAFGDASWASGTSGVAVVFVERVCGVSALLTLAASAYLVWPISGVEHVELVAVLGLLASAGAIFGIAVAHRLSEFLPARLSKPLRALPRLVDGGSFGWAVVLSFLIHIISILAVHAIMLSLFPPVKLSASAVAVPLITASVFFPLTVGGAGLREAAFAALYGAVGVPEAVAYAGSLSIWATQLITAGIGGCINLWVPLSPEDREPAD